MLAGGIEVLSASSYLITTQQLTDWQDKRVEEIQTLVVKADMYDALWCRMFDVHTIVHAENATEEWVREKNLDPDAFKREIDEYSLLSNERVDCLIEGLNDSENDLSILEIGEIMANCFDISREVQDRYTLNKFAPGG